MLFLGVFGKNVEDALGRVRYLGLYVAGGRKAEAEPGPPLGASV